MSIKDGGRRHLGSRLRTSGLGLTKWECCTEPVFHTSCRSVNISPSYSDFCKFKMAASAILVFDVGFAFPIFSDRGGYRESVIQISSRSVNIWRRYKDLCKFKMAPAAILVFDVGLPVSIFSDRGFVANVCFKFHRNWSIFDRVIVICVNSIWRPPPSWFSMVESRFPFFRSGMVYWKCVSNFIKIRQYSTELQWFA